ncbi:MAG: hypothetical protein COA43_01145 [Robiginitomaculum sp.]|nr:MAG: hypothetical protein COA43_01145 [Robiginitomaculum sp.]
MNIQTEYVVTSEYDFSGIASYETQPMDQETLAEIINKIATGEWANVTRVLAFNLTDGTIENITNDTLEAAFAQALENAAYRIDDLPELEGELGDKLMCFVSGQDLGAHLSSERGDWA